MSTTSAPPARSRKPRKLGARIASVAGALPPHYYDQEALLAEFKRLWGHRFHNPERLATIHQHVQVEGRHLALEIGEYSKLESFTESNRAYCRVATDLGQAAISDALERASLAPRDVDHIFFVSVTGVATPSIDARLMNRLGFRPDVRRTPIFGLGCVAGAAGVARAADYLAAYPEGVALVLSVELCSLTLQREDLSMANIISSGLFGDGAAALVMVGAEHRHSCKGPQLQASRSFFYPNTEQAMGWEIGSTGFRVVLSPEVPEIIAKHVPDNIDSFLQEQGLQRGDITSYVCHPGGPKILRAFEEVLQLPPDALSLTWDSLRKVGNLSSASVLMVLQDTMELRRPAPGSQGLMLAMGPGFCTELLLLQW